MNETDVTVAEAGNGTRPIDERPLQVLTADADPLARRVVREALQNAGGFAIAADAADGVDAVELALRHQPDIVVMEVALPQMDGLLATRRIVQEAPDVRVVIFSSTYEEELVLRALRDGASGYLSKEMDIESLAPTLRSVVRGEAALPRAVTMQLIEWIRRVPQTTTGLRPVRSELTTREWEVLDLMTTGATTREISEQLVLSAETVASHTKNLKRKLGVRSRAEAVAAAERMRQLTG